jgi:branched-chain amino acid transport system permease protein
LIQEETEFMKKRINSSVLGWVILIAVLYSIPIYMKSLHWLGILTFANIFVLFSISWDISSGHTGYLSLGHTFFIGLGGYASGILTHHLGFSLYTSIIISSIFAMVIGTILIIPAFRVRGPYFLMLSFALPLFLTGIVRIGYFTDYTGGHMGLFPLPVFAPVPERYKIYYLTVTIMLVIGILLWRVSKSEVGHILRAIYNDEELVGNLGLDPFKFKLFSFMISNFVAGLAGALWVHNIGSVAPHSILDLYIMVQIVIAVMIGGEGTIIGPILGSYFCIILLEALRPIAPGPWRLLVFTLIGAGMIVLRPTGIFIEICNRLDDFIQKKVRGA